MVRAREIARDQARMRRATAKGLAQQEALARRARLAGALNNVQMILSQPSFTDLALDHGVVSVPHRLVMPNRLKKAACLSNNEDYENAVLDFAIAWKFLFPMFSNKEIKEYFERDWPGFIEEFKDTFISLVMQGPFSDERRIPFNSRLFS